jgi:hypothetical protein
VSAKKPREPKAIDRAFGADSRRQLLEEYFSATTPVTPATAWLHIYRLLLWIDRTTGLAHCYESDKSQPGRPWYARSLAFHDWIASAMGSSPEGLKADIDWLFTKCTARLAEITAGVRERRAKIAVTQRAPYEGRGFPLAGEDTVLEGMVLEELAPWLTGAPPREAMQRMSQRIHIDLAHENKRKNLVGEGFEDVLAALIRHLPGGLGIDVRTRSLLHGLPGFNPPPKNQKPRKVDLALIGPGARRILISAKWSVRADREEQFGVDFETYAQLEAAGQDFEFVLITNEFDAARLVSACERRRPGATLFSSVVHVNPAGPVAVYGAKPERSAGKMAAHVGSGRLMSLEQWLGGIVR